MLLLLRCAGHLIYGCSLRPEYDSCPTQIIGRQFHRHLVPGEYTYVVHTHFSRNMPEDNVTVFQLDPKRCIGECLHDFPLHLDGFFLGHALSSGEHPPLEVCLFQQAFVLVRHNISADLGHEIHRDDHNDQQTCTAEIERHIPFDDEKLRQQTN